jgi:hypothetical protein
MNFSLFPSGSPVPHSGHLHPLPFRPMQSIDREGAWRRSRSEPPFRADGRAGPTACDQQDRFDQHGQLETCSTLLQLPVRSAAARHGATNPSAGRVKNQLARKTRQPNPSSCGISISLRELRRVNLGTFRRRLGRAATTPSLLQHAPPRPTGSHQPAPRLKNGRPQMQIVLRTIKYCPEIR